jgi:hypothetical protein
VGRSYVGTFTDAALFDAILLGHCHFQHGWLLTGCSIPSERLMYHDLHPPEQKNLQSIEISASSPLVVRWYMSEYTHSCFVSVLGKEANFGGSRGTTFQGLPASAGLQIASTVCIEPLHDLKYFDSGRETHLQQVAPDASLALLVHCTARSA